jgi:nitroreductase
MDRDNKSPVMTTIKARHQTPHVDTTPLPKKDVEFITRAIRNTPSKQNLLPYRVVVLPAQQEFKKYLVEHITWCSNRDLKRLGKVRSWKDITANNQYNHPLVIMFLTNKKLDSQGQANIEIGLAASNAMYAAAELGYSTSFARCLGGDNKFVTSVLNYPRLSVQLSVCIGKEIDNPPSLDNYNSILFNETGDPWATDRKNVNSLDRLTHERRNRGDHVEILDKEIPISKKWKLTRHP